MANFSCIKAGQVYAFQFFTRFKHASHILYIAGIKVGQVEQSQRFAASKHLLHSRHITGVET
jgi:hypothetical protein